MATGILVALVLAGVAAPLVHAAGPQQPPAGQSEFVPVSELPQAEQLPAAPLLVTAYAIVWIALLVYLWSIWRRLGRVEKEMADVARRVEAAQRR